MSLLLLFGTKFKQGTVTQSTVVITSTGVGVRARTASAVGQVVIRGQTGFDQGYTPVQAFGQVVVLGQTGFVQGYTPVSLAVVIIPLDDGTFAINQVQYVRVRAIGIRAQKVGETVNAQIVVTAVANSAKTRTASAVGQVVILGKTGFDQGYTPVQAFGQISINLASPPSVRTTVVKTTYSVAPVVLLGQIVIGITIKQGSSSRGDEPSIDEFAPPIRISALRATGSKVKQGTAVSQIAIQTLAPYAQGYTPVQAFGKVIITSSAASTRLKNQSTTQSTIVIRGFASSGVSVSRRRVFLIT